jgi:hypothetical protein
MSTGSEKARSTSWTLRVMRHSRRYVTASVVE